MYKLWQIFPGNRNTKKKQKNMNKLGIFFGQRKPPFKAHSSHDSVGNHVRFLKCGLSCAKRRQSLHSALVEIKGEQKEGLTSSVVLPALRGLRISRSSGEMFEDFRGMCPPCTCVVCGAVHSSVQMHFFLLCPARVPPSLFALPQFL